MCENDKLRLQCRPKSILAIYSANYGRFLRGKPECDALNAAGPHIGTPEPEMGPGAVRRAWHKYAVRLYQCPVAADGRGRSARGSMPRVSAECLSPDALRRVSKKCHRKGNCTVAADRATFGDPCLPGTKKQLRVSYTCGERHPRGWGRGATSRVPSAPTPCRAGRGAELPGEAGGCWARAGW